jgi:hypothetical protein
MNEPDGVEIPPIENEVTGEINQVPIAAGSTAPNRMNVPIPNPSTDRPIDYCFSNMIYWLDDSISPEQRDVLDRLLKERGGRPVARRGDDHEADDMGDGHTNAEQRDVDMVAVVPAPDHALTNDTDTNADPANNDNDDDNPVNSDPLERDQTTNPLLLNPSMARFDIDACTHIITRSWNILERRIIEQDPRLKERLNNGNGTLSGTGTGEGVSGGGGAGLWIVKVSHESSAGRLRR